jgi:hypothetical protein
MVNRTKRYSPGQSKIYKSKEKTKKKRKEILMRNYRLFIGLAKRSI